MSDWSNRCCRNLSLPEQASQMRLGIPLKIRLARPLTGRFCEFACRTYSQIATPRQTLYREGDNSPIALPVIPLEKKLEVGQREEGRGELQRFNKKTGGETSGSTAQVV